jgi:hypothetical protein
VKPGNRTLCLGANSRQMRLKESYSFQASQNAGFFNEHKEVRQYEKAIYIRIGNGGASG